MTRVAPKAGRGGRPVKSENFAVNEPGREPFYVHAYHPGTPDQCADLQVSAVWSGSKQDLTVGFWPRSGRRTARGREEGWIVGCNGKIRCVIGEVYGSCQ